MRNGLTSYYKYKSNSKNKTFQDTDNVFPMTDRLDIQIRGINFIKNTTITTTTQTSCCNKRNSKPKSLRRDLKSHEVAHK